MLAAGIVAGVLFYLTNMNMADWVMKCNNLSFFFFFLRVMTVFSETF